MYLIVRYGHLPSYDNMFKSFNINGVEYVGTAIDGYYRNLPIGECTVVVEWKDNYTGPFNFNPLNDYSFHEFIGLNDTFFKGITPIGSLSYMFYECIGLISLDLTELDVSNVTDMERMFYYCNSLTSLDLSKWNTSNVTNMSYMFHMCELLDEIKGFEDWDMSNVTNMNHMFSECGLMHVDLTKWDTGRVHNSSFKI